jgi:hypothetical protein
VEEEQKVKINQGLITLAVGTPGPETRDGKLDASETGFSV